MDQLDYRDSDRAEQNNMNEASLAQNELADKPGSEERYDDGPDSGQLLLRAQAGQRLFQNNVLPRGGFHSARRQLHGP